MNSMENIVSYEVVTELSSEIVIRLYKSAGWWEDSDSKPEIIPAMIKGSFCFVIAKTSSEVIGMGRAISDGVSDAYIQDVVVLQEFRGKGIGKKLVNKLTDFCVQKGIMWVGLIGEPGTASFYKSIGYSELLNYIPMRYNQ